jgi:hypothetical protein
MNKNEPVFKPIFAEKWNSLPPVMKKHYANKPFSNDVVTVRGKMNFIIAPWARRVMPLFRFLKILVPYPAENVDAAVHFRSEPDSGTYQFDRWIELPRQTYNFLSKMEHNGGDEIVEKFASGICWRMKYTYDGEKVLLLHKGYALKIFGKIIPLPISAIVGKGYAEEVPIDENSFRMRMTVTHPLFGVYYEYNGVFTVTEMNL